MTLKAVVLKRGKLVLSQIPNAELPDFNFYYSNPEKVAAAKAKLAGFNLLLKKAKLS